MRIIITTTVDGTNPAPVDILNYPIICQSFIHPRWLAGFLPSPLSLYVFPFQVTPWLRASRGQTSNPDLDAAKVKEIRNR